MAHRDLLASRRDTESLSLSRVGGKICRFPSFSICVWVYVCSSIVVVYIYSAGIGSQRIRRYILYTADFPGYPRRRVLGPRNS